VLRTKDKIVVTAEYNFHARSNNTLNGARGMLIDALEKYGKLTSSNEYALFWQLDTGVLTDKPIRVALSKVSFTYPSTYSLIIAVRLLDDN